MSLPVLCATLLPAVPFVLALIGLLLPLSSRATAALFGVGGAAVALIAAVLLAFGIGDTPVEEFIQLAEFGDIEVTAGVRVDLVTAWVAIAVGVVATAVQVYSVAYLRDDDRYVPYAAQVNLFTAAMLLVVVASDLVQLLIGWEVMGICSYLLIGHDRRLPEAPAAAVKAFLVTRVGDVGFWIGIVLIGLSQGTFRISELGGGEAVPTLALILLLAGVAGKSAQFPLHTWLPDAMAGPTPISALIHAATMVAAGVYVVARLYPVYHPDALAVLGVMAAITMLIGALAACAQEDIKRVLAWSTVSQVGYMAAALAVGSANAGLSHLLTHAAFKALLFLAAGAVIHAVGSNLMSHMGGLWRAMPTTFITMTIGLAALAGLPPLSGFWSKELIIGVAWHQAADGHDHTWVAWLVLTSALLTAGVTAWYATRLWLRTFFGVRRGDAAPHDPPPAMGVPLWVLAVPAALLGLLLVWPGASGLGLGFTDHGGESTSEPGLYQYGISEPVEWVSIAVTLLVTAAGAVAAWAVWRHDPAGDPARILGPARSFLAYGFRLDDLQARVVVRPVQALARLVRAADERAVDGAVEGTGSGTTGLAGWLARLHGGGLPRYTTTVLAGVLLIGAAVGVTEVLG